MENDFPKLFEKIVHDTLSLSQRPLMMVGVVKTNTQNEALCLSYNHFINSIIKCVIGWLSV